MTAPTNFAFLAEHDPQLVRFGMLAERYFPEDPNTCLIKLRQLTELLAQLVASRTGLFVSAEEGHFELLHRLQFRGLLPREIAGLFHEVRDCGNKAAHDGSGDHRAALAMLRFSWQLGVWYHRTFKDRQYKSGAFIPPAAPKDESAELRAELDRLKGELEVYRKSEAGTTRRLEATEAELRAARQDQAFWEQMASEAESAKAALAGKLAALQEAAAGQSAADVDRVVAAADAAATAVDLDEADTRQLIDDQLRAEGWEVDTKQLTHSRGARPEKGRNRAIAEWPTADGIADYVLFVGLTPMAAVEAKRQNIDVSASLQQAERYARGFAVSPSLSTYGAPWGEYRLPFAFSSNGRPYLEQVKTKCVLPARVRDWRRSGLIAFLSRLIRAIGGTYGQQRERAAAGLGASAATAG